MPLEMADDDDVGKRGRGGRERSREGNKKEKGSRDSEREGGESLLK